jgi:hypothetical protein
MSAITNIHVIQYVHHRNGMSGVGFYAVNFFWKETPRGAQFESIATVSTDDLESFRNGVDHDPDTRVLMIRDGGVDIEQTLRGDNFHKALCEYLIKAEDERRAHVTAQFS